MEKREFTYTTPYGETIALIPELALYQQPVQSLFGNPKNIAIQLFSRDENGNVEPYSVLTVNIDEFISLKNAAYIDTNNNTEAIIDFLVDNDFGRKTQYAKKSGFCTYPLFVFNEQMLKNIDYNGVYAEYETRYNEALGI